VEREGGAVAAITSGLIRGVIVDGAVRRQTRFEAGVRPMVGVDRLRSEDGGLDEWAIRPTDGMTEEAEQRRCDEIRELRRTREQRRTAQALKEVEQAARRGENSVPAVLDAVRSYATVGEISNVFREVFGEWQPDRTF
jgi:methylmalonyl-CoA mutase N-terminal domain/subunit